MIHRSRRSLTSPQGYQLSIVAAIASKIDESLYPTEVPIPKGEGGVTADSIVLLNQIRSIDRRRLVRKLGTVKPDTMKRVKKALQISVGLVET